MKKKKFQTNKYEIINKTLPGGLILRIYRHFPILGKCLLKIRENYIERHLWRDFKNVISLSSQELIESRIESRSNVWIFWGQGIEQMPPLVKKCYQSINTAFSERNVIVLTMTNYRDYIQIDQNIEDKVRDGKISLTTFSDIIRCALLEKYGGIWCDATLYFGKECDIDFSQYEFFTLRHKPCFPQIELEPSRAKWRAFFMASGEGNILMKYCNILFREYFKYNNTIVDYFLIDYFIKICYKHNDMIKQYIDNIPFYSNDLYKLYATMDKEYMVDEYEDIINNAYIQKLNWRGDFRIVTDSGKKTVYNYWINNNSYEIDNTQ